MSRESSAGLCPQSSCVLALGLPVCSSPLLPCCSRHEVLQPAIEEDDAAACCCGGVAGGRRTHGSGPGTDEHHQAHQVIRGGSGSPSLSGRLRCELLSLRDVRLTISQASRRKGAAVSGSACALDTLSAAQASSSSWRMLPTADIGVLSDVNTDVNTLQPEAHWLPEAAAL